MSASRPGLHRPRFYRYQVAHPGLRFTLNRYAGCKFPATIGIALTAGRYAYCVKWANAGLYKRPPS